MDLQNYSRETGRKLDFEDSLGQVISSCVYIRYFFYSDLFEKGIVLVYVMKAFSHSLERKSKGINNLQLI